MNENFESKSCYNNRQSESSNLIINPEFILNPDFNEEEKEITTNFQIKQRICTGTAPYLKFTTTVLEESDNESEIDQQFGMACQQERCTIAEVENENFPKTTVQPFLTKSPPEQQKYCDPRDSKTSQTFKEIEDGTGMQQISFKEGNLEMTSWQRTQLEASVFDNDELDPTQMDRNQNNDTQQNLLFFDDNRSLDSELELNYTNRLINGLEAEEGEAPYYVRLLACTRFDSKCNRCGGAWITGHEILTAAHCLDGDVEKVYFYTNPESQAYSGYSTTWKMHECYKEDESIA